MPSLALRWGSAYAVAAALLAVAAWWSAAAWPAAAIPLAAVAVALVCQGVLFSAHLRLARRAHLDALTGLPNRAHLVDRAARVLASGRPAALVFLDLDAFKVVNDTHGHIVGDRVLVEVAERVRQVAGPDAVVARYGGDEFAVLATSGAPGASRLVAHLDNALRFPIATPRPVHVSASAGVAVASGGSVQDLLAAADSAMYEVKRRSTGIRTAIPNRETEIAPA
jgi:diguanylate cyclase (GGDEF)-like protein